MPTLEKPIPVSLVLPVRNEERFIDQCLRSLLAQDYPGEIELIIVDGQSTDRTTEIVREVFWKDGFFAQTFVAASGQSGAEEVPGPEPGNSPGQGESSLNH